MKRTIRKESIKRLYARILGVIESRPLVSFLTALTLVVGLIIIGSILRKPKVTPAVEPAPKQVNLYQIGSVPTLNFQGQIEKSGTTTIVALAPGIVQKINVKVGQNVNKGTTLVSLSQNYQGGSSASIARQIAGAQRDLAESTYNDQLEAINKQRDLANQNADNFAKMGEISRAAAADLHSVIDLNNKIIDTLQAQLNLLNADPVGNATTILSTQQYLVQFKGSNAQLAASLRSAEYQGDVVNPPTALASTQHDLALKQLDLQEKSLSLNRDLATLSYKVAQINESMYYPASPFKGVVQRIFVHPGQFVNPGTPLAVVANSGSNADVIVLVDSRVAKEVSRLQPSIIKLGDNALSLTPAFVSTEAISGNQYAITYHLTEATDLPDNSFVTVSLPVGNADTALSKTPVIPLDSIYQSSTTSTVFVVKDGRATPVTVKLGSVMGDYVEVIEGLQVGDRVILDRTITDGVRVEE